MRRIFQNLSTILLLVVTLPVHVVVTAPHIDSIEPDSGAVLCPPGIYPTLPSDCLPLGPSEFLTNMSKVGIFVPIRPLPAYPPSTDLNLVPYQYFRVNPAGAPLFNSLDAALTNQPAKFIPPGNLLYVSYQSRVETDQGIFYNLHSNYWIRGDGARISASTFQGLRFSSTPDNSFGWVKDEVRSRSAPGFSSPSTSNTYYRLNIVQVYAVQTVDNIEWDMIGPGEWVNASQVARVDPVTSPPEGVTSSRWIEINLQEQTLAVYQDNRLVFATLIASGLDPFWTRPGKFHIYQKKLSELMTTSDKADFYYLEDVPWTMYFDDKRALHGSYWRTLFGFPQSHGCVNLSVGDARWLYDWAVVGDWVWVHDPTNQTPTDPALYGAGAP